MEHIAKAIASKYYGTTPQKITSLGGGWYGRVFLAEMAAEPTKVIVKIQLLPNLAEKEARQLKVLAAHATLKIRMCFSCTRQPLIFRTTLSLWNISRGLMPATIIF